MNIYFPDAWIEQASRDLEYKLATNTLSNADGCYLLGINQLDLPAYCWLTTVALMNLWNIPLAVPAWVYTYTHNPERRE